MRTLYDDQLMEWTVWAVPSRGGMPQPGRLIFRSTGEPNARARQVTIPEGRGSAEAVLESASTSELKELLAGAEPIN